VTETVRCRKCNEIIKPGVVAFGSKATGWEHPFVCGKFYKLSEECDRYGLPHEFHALMTHLYANQNLVNEINKQTIRKLVQVVDLLAEAQGVDVPWVKRMREEDDG
jgi:hypothetical protein